MILNGGLLAIIATFRITVYCDIIIWPVILYWLGAGPDPHIAGPKADEECICPHRCTAAKSLGASEPSLRPTAV